MGKTVDAITAVGCICKEDACKLATKKRVTTVPLVAILYGGARCPVRLEEVDEESPVLIQRLDSLVEGKRYACIDGNYRLTKAKKKRKWGVKARILTTDEVNAITQPH